MRKFLIYRKNFLKFMYQKAYINWIRKKKKKSICTMVRDSLRLQMYHVPHKNTNLDFAGTYMIISNWLFYFSFFLIVPRAWLSII